MIDTPRVNVLIPTLNEAEHIIDCVANARELGDVFVIDSFSTDGTQAMARSAGATVVEHKFIDYAKQKNWALANIPFTGEWIFILDADERIPSRLRMEVTSRLQRQREYNGFYVNRELLIFGQRVRHGGLYPSWNLRLFRRGKARYEDRSVHEHMMCEGPTEYMRHPMLHIRLETVSQYIAKHIRYAEMESNEWAKTRLGVSREAPTEKLFRHHLRWRQWLRRYVWPRTPARPLLRWAYMYLFRFGFLDGRAGWHLACLMANYEYMITLMYRDKLQMAKEGRPLPWSSQALASGPTPAPQQPADAPTTR